MSEWKAKRFWKAASVVEVEGSFAIELDGRGVKTPAKQAMHVPTHAMASAIAQEWDAQEKGGCREGGTHRKRTDTAIQTPNRGAQSWLPRAS